MYLPEYVQNCIDTLQQRGFACYAVGGCVRDACLGLTPHDYDLCTDALPVDIRTAFSDNTLVLAGEKHGTVGVVTEQGIVEITTFRTEGDYTDSRHPGWVTFVKSIEDEEIGKDHVNEGAKFSIINAESIKIIINKPGTKALNRGIFAFLESLVDFSRIDIIDGEKRDEYINRFKENERVIDVVAEDDVKEAMKDLKEKLIEKGLDL